MKIRELIEELGKFDPELEVSSGYRKSSDYVSPIIDLEKVKLIEGEEVEETVVLWIDSYSWETKGEDAFERGVDEGMKERTE